MHVSLQVRETVLEMIAEICPYEVNIPFFVLRLHGMHLCDPPDRHPNFGRSVFVCIEVHFCNFFSVSSARLDAGQCAAGNHNVVGVAIWILTGERNDPKSRFAISIFYHPELAIFSMSLVLYCFRKFTGLRRSSGISHSSDTCMWKYRRKITDVTENSARCCKHPKNSIPQSATKFCQI